MVRAPTATPPDSGAPTVLTRPDGTPTPLGELALDLPERYQALSLLGRGGMGFVVAARDRRTGREVAVKLLSPELRARPELCARLLREGAALASLDHPSIVRVYEVDPDALAIVMELVRGESLRARLDRRGREPPAEVRRIGLALLDALRVAHAAGIVHRDVKPANVLLDGSGAVKLADFGIASIDGSDLTRAGASLGTPSYMPPEQLRGQRVDARADIYALGVTLFELATGTRLHHHGDLVEDPGAAVAAATGDGALAQAIARALRERPADRYPDAAAFAAALGAATRPRRLRAWLARAAAVLAVTCLSADLLPAAAPRAPPPRGAIALLPFDDRTGDPRLDFAASGLPNLIGMDLEGTRDRPVVGYYRLLERVDGPAAPRAAWLAAARQLGADRVIWGEVTPDRGGLRVRAVAADADGAPLGSVDCRAAGVAEVPDCARSCGHGLAGALGATVASPPGERRPLAAEQALQRGIAAVEEHRFAQAEVWFLEARQLDPESNVVAYYEALTSWWIDRPSEVTLGLIERAARGELAAAQRSFLQGLRLLVTGDYPLAAERFRALAERFPGDRDILYGLFEALYHAGLGTEAMAVYRRVTDLSPRFRLGLLHVFDHAVAHGDEAALDWALDRPGVRTEALYATWFPRARLARRDPEGALRLLETALQGEGSDDGRRGGYELERIHAYAISERSSLALAVATRMIAVTPGHAAIELHALHVARGGVLEGLRAAADRGIAAMPALWDRQAGWLALAQLELPAPDPARLRELGANLARAAIERRQATTVPAHVSLALVAGALDDAVALARHAASPFPEAAAVAEAFQAERAGRSGDAVRAWDRAVSLSIDGRFDVAERFFLARAARAAGDHAAVRRACDELVRPRVFSWAWASGVGPCLAWQAESARAMGDRVEQRRSLERLIALRAEAPSGDPLVRAARADLAAAGP
jgi:serine/threonine-protein kinase